MKKKFLQILVIALAIGAIIQTVTSALQKKDTLSTKDSPIGPLAGRDPGV